MLPARLGAHRFYRVSLGAWGSEATSVLSAILDCDLAEEVRGKCTRELKTVKNITVDKDSVIQIIISFNSMLGVCDVRDINKGVLTIKCVSVNSQSIICDQSSSYLGRN